MTIRGLKKSKSLLKLKKKKKSPISIGLEEEEQQQQKEEIAEHDESMMTMNKKKKRKLMDESVVNHKVKKSKKGEGIKKKNDIKNGRVLQEELDGENSKVKKSGKMGKKDISQRLRETTDTESSEANEVYEIPAVDDDCSKGMKNSKVKKSGKVGKKDISQRLRETTDTESNEANEVYEIPAVDDDCSKGMKKWVTEYHQRRPGLEILQQEIDDFIVAYEARKEKERKEREALAAEGGWTVVTHHKGRKKTMDAESGIAVGSVAEAAVLEKIAKKKNKEPAKDFYRFQRREAQRNEVMMLQSKFEQDKKRIQQLRAARKFRPF